MDAESVPTEILNDRACAEAARHFAKVGDLDAAALEISFIDDHDLREECIGEIADETTA